MRPAGVGQQKTFAVLKRAASEHKFDHTHRRLHAIDPDLIGIHGVVSWKLMDI